MFKLKLREVNPGYVISWIVIILAVIEIVYFIEYL